MIQEWEMQCINIRPENCMEGAASKVNFNGFPERNTKQFYYIHPSVRLSFASPRQQPFSLL